MRTARIDQLCEASAVFGRKRLQRDRLLQRSKQPDSIPQNDGNNRNTIYINEILFHELLYQRGAPQIQISLPFSMRRARRSSQGLRSVKRMPSLSSQLRCVIT